MKYDLILVNSAKGKRVQAMSRGYFEHLQEMSLDNKPIEFIEIDDNRINKAEYEKHKGLFDKFIGR